MSAEFLLFPEIEKRRERNVIMISLFFCSDEIFESAEDDDLVSTLDPDHRLMLQNTLCLMQSRNSAVVLATAVLHFYMAPPAEVQRIAKPMVRLLHVDRETEYVALANIATMAATYPRLFSDVVDEFFVAGCESLPTRTLKLDILTRSANEQNIGRILKELKEYSKDENKEFVAAAVQAIGRCATALPDVADSCMQQLVQLMVGSSSQTVVAESIVVIKRLLQMNASKDGGAEGGDAHEQERAEQRDVRIIKQLARMLADNSVTIPQARAAIIWLVGEYNRKIPERAPDVLRCLAKSFLDESDLVKLQILTLGAKLVLAAEPAPPAPRVLEILRYVLQLAKYDQNYDVRDRARLLRRLLFTEPDPAHWNDVRRAAHTLFMTEKPVPAFESVSDLSAGYVLGTLSHIIHDVAPGYHPLDDFPEVAPDPAVRNPPAAQAAEPEFVAPKLGAFTGLAPGQDPDAYLFGQGDGLGDDADADDGWGAGWDDDDEDNDDGAATKKKGAAAEAEDDDDDWGMGNDGDNGFGAAAEKQEDEGDLWDLGDEGAETKAVQEETGEDDWGVGDAEKPQKEEDEAKEEEQAVKEEPEPAQTEEKESGDAPPEGSADAAEPEKVEEKPAEEAAPATVVADVEEGEADE